MVCWSLLNSSKAHAPCGLGHQLPVVTGEVEGGQALVLVRYLKSAYGGQLVGPAGGGSRRGYNTTSDYSVQQYLAMKQERL